MEKVSLNKAREMLENAQNPFFLYDNDADGFCSFVLLRRWLERGTSLVVRSYPALDERYAHAAVEAHADLVVVLDRAVLGENFLAVLERANVPILWLDHHVSEMLEGFPLVSGYNPIHSGKEAVPVTAIAYAITKRKGDLWIAMMGCIADHYLPDFVSDFKKKHKELWGTVKKPFDAYFGTEIGRLARAVGFGIKDSLTGVRYVENFFIECMSVEQAFGELDSDSIFAHAYRNRMHRYRELIGKALELKGPFIFFRYSGLLSVNAELANELCYRFPKAFVVVAYTHHAIANISIRGKHALSVLNEAIINFPSASGGGHQEAVGARIKTSELNDFVACIEELAR